MSYNPPPSNAKKQDDRRPRSVRAAEQNLQKGYALQIDHAERTALFVHRRGFRPSLEISYEAAVEAFSALQDEYPEHFVIRGSKIDPRPRKPKSKSPAPAMETITEAPAKPADEADIRYVAVDLPVVLDQPWYTTSELMKIFGITAPGAFSQFWRTVEHKSTKEGKAYRTGKALLERIEQTRGIDAQAKLASEYAAVEGRAPQKTKPGKIKAKVVDAPAPKKPDPTPAKVIDPTAQTASTAPKPAETSVAEDRVSANGHVSAPSLTGGINKIYGLKPRPMIGDEETLSKIEAYAGLLHSLLFDADDVDMAMVFLAGDVAHLAEGLLGRMRPAIDAITEPA